MIGLVCFFVIVSHTLVSGANIDCFLASNSTGLQITTCTSIAINDDMRKCCYVEYQALNGTQYQKCKIIEDTEFGLKVYKHTLSHYRNINIQCSGNWLFPNIFICLVLLLFYLY